MGRKSDAKQRLMQVAQHWFWTRSCQAVSVDMLCREAGVNKGSFYHFFESKQAILLATLDGLWTQLREELIEPAFDPSQPPVQRIRSLFERSFKMQKRAFDAYGAVPGCPFLNMGAEMSTQDEEVRQRVEAITRRYTLYIESALREAAIASDLQVAAPALAQSIYSSLSGLMLQAKIANRPEVILEGIDTALSVIDQRSQQLSLA